MEDDYSIRELNMNVMMEGLTLDEREKGAYRRFEDENGDTSRPDQDAIRQAWNDLSEEERAAYKKPDKIVYVTRSPDTEAPLFDLLTDDLIFEVFRHLGARSLSYVCCASRALSNIVESTRSDELWKAALQRRQDSKANHDHETLRFRAALAPGGLRALQGWSFKKRFIDAHLTIDALDEKLLTTFGQESAGGSE